jgi:single-strand DNA-binding protein
LVYVEGKLQTRQWQDAQGVKRYTTEIVAREIKLLDSAGSRPGQSTGENYSKPGTAPSYTGQSGMEELPPPANSQEDEIPF